MKARTLGAAPVIYFYNDKIDGNLTTNILSHIGEIHSILLALSHIEAKAESLDKSVLSECELQKFGYVDKREPKVHERQKELHRDKAREILNYLNTERAHAWCLVDWLEILLDFFQTADSRTTIGSLAYYKQREWRISRVFSDQLVANRLISSLPNDGGGSMPEEIRLDIRNRLRSVNPIFFTEARLDGCSILHGTTDSPFFDFVEEIVAPKGEGSYKLDLLLKNSLLPYRFTKEDNESSLYSVFKKEKNSRAS